MKIRTKDYHGNFKNYGGDFLLTRLVKNRDGDDFERVDKDNEDKKQSITIIPGTMVDYNNGSYSTTLPLLFPGNYRIEIIVLRNSETCTA